jgi:hypothetical protein
MCRPLQIALLDVVLDLIRAPLRSHLVLDLSNDASSAPKVRDATIHEAPLVAAGIHLRREVQLLRDALLVQNDAFDDRLRWKAPSPPVTTLYGPVHFISNGNATASE